MANPLSKEDLANQTKFQVVVPIYNEGKNILELYNCFQEHNIFFDSLKFVYDFDEDNSLPFIKTIQEKDNRVVAEKNLFGRGVINALRWGFAHCKPGPVIIVMGDNSDKLSIIPQMLEHWQNGATIVCPSRYMPGGKQHGGGFVKSSLSRLAGKSLKLFGFPTSDATNNFKLYDGAWLSKQQVESIGGFEIAIELCYKAFKENRKIVELPTEWFDRTYGQSQFKLFKWLPLYLKWYFATLKLLVKRKVRLA